VEQKNRGEVNYNTVFEEPLHLIRVSFREEGGRTERLVSPTRLQTFQCYFTQDRCKRKLSARSPAFQQEYSSSRMSPIPPTNTRGVRGPNNKRVTVHMIMSVVGFVQEVAEEEDDEVNHE
jgi:hypothetical protein